ncbi:MAG: DUF1080 domain-containing protein [Planctomycetota bacterium]
MCQKRRPAVASAVPMLAAAAAAAFVLPSAGPARASEPDWQPLFDGKSLDGWIKRGGDAQYRVEGTGPDAAIVGTAVPGTPNTFLCTQREFADFILDYEFNVDPRLNSGVQIRSNSVPGYRNGVVHGYQVEIDPSPRAWTGGIYDEARRAVYLPDRKTPIEKNEAAHRAFRQNEWNHVRVECRGDSLRTWLNDVPVADVQDELTHSGFIGLQVHSIDKSVMKDAADRIEVRWRNLRIKDLCDPWRKPPAEAHATVLLGPNGDLSAWEHPAKSATQPASAVQWVWTGGALEVKPGSGNIQTRQPFGACRLHVEFSVDDNGKSGQANGNSGVYLQGRYEVQILNSAGQTPADDICGGIYKVKAADYNMARPAGAWQTYDIWFHPPQWHQSGQKTANARITVYHNATRIHDNVEVPRGTTAGSKEGPHAAPLLLQDHGNKIRFRNIWIALPDATAAATNEASHH